MRMMEFKLPDLGEGINEGQILSVYIVEGQSIAEDDLLMEVETDKAAVEIPSPCSGTVVTVHVKDNQIVQVGDVMVTFDTGVDTTVPSSKPASAQPMPTKTSQQEQGPIDAVRSSPSVRKLARTLSIDISAVTGTGSGGRITKQDVELAASNFPDRQPEEPSKQVNTITTVASPSHTTLSIETEIDGIEELDEYGIVIRQSMSQARKSIAKAMSVAWATIPHVTDCNDADITEIDALRRNFTDPDRPNLKLTLLPFILKAVCRALKKNPILNAAIDATTGDVLFRTYINIAIGVQSERGLIAPVLRHIDSMSIGEISEQLEQITANARSASFEIADTRGATYTVSNAGAVGRTRYSTPIVQQNTVACLAVGRAKLMPWVVEDQIVPRLILPLSHSFDHRLVDGGREIPFIEHLINDLEHPMRFAV
jgi:pyruvate dehydrogenase E2 component (dihydrolipoamide acetyltransferase)